MRHMTREYERKFLKLNGYFKGLDFNAKEIEERWE